MTDVFISYKREDDARVALLVQALQREGVAPWWDQGLPGRENWRANIQHALDAARCVIVVWTRESTGPAGDFVRDEAAQGKGRGILVPVIFDNGVRLPLGFGELQAIDLRHWRGRRTDPFFRDLVDAIQATVDGRAAPPSRGPMARMAKRLKVASVASVATTGLFAFAMNFLSVQDRVCTMPFAQPGLSDACGAVRLGDRPSQDERVAFEALPPGDCAALSAYRDAHENSPLRALVDSRLADRKPVAEPKWVSRIIPLTLFQPQTARPANTRPQARAAALAAAQGQATRLCQTAAASGLYRVLRATPVASEWQCDATGGGFVCSFMGRADCQAEQRETVYQCGDLAR